MFGKPVAVFRKSRKEAYVNSATGDVIAPMDTIEVLVKKNAVKPTDPNNFVGGNRVEISLSIKAKNGMKRSGSEGTRNLGP